MARGACLGLDSEMHRVVMVPEMGAKIVSLVDKRGGFEWMVGPGTRPVKPVAYGAWWHEQDMAGWDEMFPTIIACPFPGRARATARRCPITARHGPCRGA